MQNKQLDDVIGEPDAPFINRIAAQCGVATNYSWVGHPTHIHATAGTQAIASGCEPTPCSTSTPNIFSAVKAAGNEWRSYEESMPRNCYRKQDEPYVVDHNPALFYSNVRADCAAWDVPMGTTTSGRFADDLDRDRLPAFSFVTPNNCSNTHDCDLAIGDRWLRAWVGRITQSPGYVNGQTALFVVWDTGGDADDCLTNPDRACLVPAIVVSPFTPPGTRTRERFSHYSLLRTTEELLGLPRLLGGARRAASMRAAFGL
jgi:phospholipase C